EAVLLFWLSQKSKINGFKIGAIIVQCLSVFSLVMDWGLKYVITDNSSLTIIVNPIFITGIVVLVSFIATLYIIKNESASLKVLGYNIPLSFYQNGLIVVAVGIGYFVGILEIIYQAHQYIENQTSALSFSVMYHFVFSAVFLFFGLRSNNTIFKKVSILLTLVNIGLYVFYFYKLSYHEMAANYNLETSYNYAFVFHYIILACFIYFGFALIKHPRETTAFLNSNLMLWVFAFST